MANDHDVRPGTLSAVLRVGDGVWGLSAGHFMSGLPDHEKVWYFPESRRTLLGTYLGPVAENAGEDLARFSVHDELALTIPVGFGRVPRLISEEAIDDLAGKELLFLGGQIGKVTARLDRIAQFRSHPRALYVHVHSATLLTGDSGGPLYFDAGSELFWVGTLLAGRPKDGAPGACEGVFLAPHRGLARLGLVT